MSLKKDTSNKTKVEEEEKNPFAIKPSDPIGMTEDIKREVRIKTQMYAARFVQGKEKNIGDDLQLKAIQLDSMKNLHLKPQQHADLSKAVTSLKWSELARHLQVWTNNPTRIPSNYQFSSEQVTESKKRLEKLSTKRKTVISGKKYKQRMAVKYKSDKWDFTRMSKQEAKSLAKKDQNKTVTKDTTSEVAKRLAKAKEAAQARARLLETQDD